MSDTRTEQYLSPLQVGDLLGIPVATVYRWNSEGTGPPRLRIGKHVRYRRSDVDAWLSSRAEVAR